MAVSHIELKSVESLLQKRVELSHACTELGLADSAIYQYVKQSTFFKKAEQRMITFFFQGLNTYPQNLSIFLRDECQRQQRNLGSKQRLAKGIFILWNSFMKCDCIIEISIPGNLRIFKMTQDKKELLSNDEINTLYVSSVLRTFYQRNLIWGRYYDLFENSINCLEEFGAFLEVFLQVIPKLDLFVGDDFQAEARIKGSHACSLLIKFAIRKGVVPQTLDLLLQALQKQPEARKCGKVQVLLCQLYIQSSKAGEAVKLMLKSLKSHSDDPYFVYYAARACRSHGLLDQAMQMYNSIIQFNQLDVWTELADCYMQKGHCSPALLCLNHAIPLTKTKPRINMDAIYRQFESLGKIHVLGNYEQLYQYSRLMLTSQTPLNIPPSTVDPQLHPLLQNAAWKLNKNERKVYKLLQDMMYRVGSKKFQQQLEMAFMQKQQKHPLIALKRGITESMFMIEPTNQPEIEERMISVADQQLPTFLQEEITQVPPAETPNRNLSIIPEIESMIQNSRWDEAEATVSGPQIKTKKIPYESLLKFIRVLVNEPEFCRHEVTRNNEYVLPVYNKLRSATRNNNYFLHCLFNVFEETGQYRAIIILIAETLDFLEHNGMRKITKLPYWMQRYVFVIIREKGLNFLNELLGKLNFIDEALVDTIQLAQKWKVSGITF